MANKKKKATQRHDDDDTMTADGFEDAHQQRRRAVVTLQSHARRRQAAQRVEERRKARVEEQQNAQPSARQILEALSEAWRAERRACEKPGYPGSLAPPKAVSAELARFAAIRRASWLSHTYPLKPGMVLLRTGGDITPIGSSDYGSSGKGSDRELLAETSSW